MQNSAAGAGLFLLLKTLLRCCCDTTRCVTPNYHLSK